MRYRSPEYRHAEYTKRRDAGKKMSLTAKETSAYRALVRIRVLMRYGGECCKCGNKDPRVLQIDHVNGGGNAEGRRKGVGFMNRVLRDTTGKYQLLCANCNWIKKAVNKEWPQQVGLLA